MEENGPDDCMLEEEMLSLGAGQDRIAGITDVA